MGSSQTLKGKAVGPFLPMTVREDMLEFWNEHDPQKARWLIVDADNWDKEIEPHMKLILAGDKKVQDYVCSLQQSGESTLALEIGCGIGRLMKPMTDFFSYVVGLDISKTMQEQSKAYLDKDRASVRLISNGNNFLEGDSTKAFVYSLICFQHIPALHIIDNYLAESFRVLKPGGMIRVQTHRGIPNPANKFCGFAGHMFRNVKAFAERFERAGFTVVTTQDGLGHPEWLWVTALKPDVVKA